MSLAYISSHGAACAPQIFLPLAYRAFQDRREKPPRLWSGDESIERYAGSVLTGPDTMESYKNVELNGYLHHGLRTLASTAPEQRKHLAERALALRGASRPRANPSPRSPSCTSAPTHTDHVCGHRAWAALVLGHAHQQCARRAPVGCSSAQPCFLSCVNGCTMPPKTGVRSFI